MRGEASAHPAGWGIVFAVEGPLVAIDLNGVLDTYSGWKGPEHWDVPRPGAAEFLDALRARGYHIVIPTTRWRDDAEAWLRKYGLLDRVERVSAHWE